MSSRRLTETSYIVLGLVEQIGPSTPYDLKRMAQASTINFWSVPHTQLYTESARLASEGLLSEEREQTGRRRRIYTLTQEGSRVLEDWRAEPTRTLDEVRDVATLKLFFGANPTTLAGAQLQAHERHLKAAEELYEKLSKSPDSPRGWLLALEVGIGHEHEFIRFWSRIAQDGGAQEGAAHEGTAHEGAAQEGGAQKEDS